MRISGSIRTKLVASTVAVLTAIIAVTAVYFRQTHVAELAASQRQRMFAYSGMLALQARSAVAFEDRATSRELLDSLIVDPEVVSIVLFGDRGDRLYQRGAPSAWVRQAAAGVTETRVVSLADRNAVVTPVQSVEGPRGTLVIEASTDRITAHARAITRMAVAAGALALLVGFIAVGLITRPMLRRLRRMAEVASFVGSDADGNDVLAAALAVEIDSDDELGALGKAFNDMLTHIRSQQTRLCDAVADLTASEIKLERRFERRKQALKNVNQQLRNEMDRRTKIELELRQAQKLESVGRLAAGIAHEINTPIQFVSDSCSFLQDATNDLMTVITANRELRRAVLANEITAADALDKIRIAETAADVDYILEQIPQAIDRSLQGLERVATIVRSMKEFAHPDQQEAYADLNRAITSTIVVARNEYKYVADLETDLAELPPISCHIGELNQVVLNIVVNAAHAIESVVKDTDRRGKIRVRTTLLDDHAVIEISDNGCGISQANIDKVFDPFFTTKELGKGTGQGLAIARAVIVDKHHGKLTVDSEVGRGTTFRIWLPITASAPEPLALAS